MLLSLGRASSSSLFKNKNNFEGNPLRLNVKRLYGNNLFVVVLKLPVLTISSNGWFLFPPKYDERVVSFEPGYHWPPYILEHDFVLLWLTLIPQPPPLNMCNALPLKHNHFHHFPWYRRKISLTKEILIKMIPTVATKCANSNGWKSVWLTGRCLIIIRQQVFNLIKSENFI